jgi:hypothetical protein
MKTSENSIYAILIFPAILDIIETLQVESVSTLKDLSKTVPGYKICQIQLDL